MLRRRPLGLYVWVSVIILTIVLPIRVQAALIPLSGLLVDKMALTIAITGAGTYPLSLIVPANITMGASQNPIAQFFAPIPAGAVSAIIFSAGFGVPIPSPSFSSYPACQISPWSLIHSPAGEKHNPFTGAHAPHQLDNFHITHGSGVDARTVAGTTDIALARTPPANPMPVAVWLLGSGLLGMVTVARHKNT